MERGLGANGHKTGSDEIEAPVHEKAGKDNGHHHSQGGSGQVNSAASQ